LVESLDDGIDEPHDDRVTRVGAPKCMSAESGICVWAKMWRAQSRNLPENGDRGVPQLGSRGFGGGDTEGPDRPSLSVIRFRVIHPTTLEGEAIVEPTSGGE